MSRRVQDKKPKRARLALEWINENLAEQEARYRAIAKEMDGLEPTRRKWYAEFLKIIQTRGYNVTGDTRRAIGRNEVPRKPARRDRVVY
jgi:hypothetical protein